MATAREIVERFYELQDTPEYQRIAPLIHPDIRVIDGVPGDWNGRDNFVSYVGMFHQSFPGFTTEVHRVLVDGDSVTVYHTHHATNTGSFLGLPPTGLTAHVPGIEILTVKDEQIIEFVHHDDFLSLFLQLGLVQMPAPAVA